MADLNDDPYAEARNRYGRMVVYVKGAEGPILLAAGAFEAEVKERGWDLSDHDVTPPTSWHGGLFVFEGYVEYGPEPEPDVLLRGVYRRMTSEEVLRFGMGDAPWQT